MPCTLPNMKQGLNKYWQPKETPPFYNKEPEASCLEYGQVRITFRISIEISCHCFIFQQCYGVKGKTYLGSQLKASSTPHVVTLQQKKSKDLVRTIEGKWIGCHPHVTLYVSSVTAFFPKSSRSDLKRVTNTWGNVRGCRETENTVHYRDLLWTVSGWVQRRIGVFENRMNTPKPCSKTVLSLVRKLLILRDEQTELHAPWNWKAAVAQWGSHSVCGSLPPTKVPLHCGSHSELALHNPRVRERDPSLFHNSQMLRSNKSPCLSSVTSFGQ